MRMEKKQGAPFGAPCVSSPVLVRVPVRQPAHHRVGGPHGRQEVAERQQLLDRPGIPLIKGAISAHGRADAMHGVEGHVPQAQHGAR